MFECLEHQNLKKKTLEHSRALYPDNNTINPDEEKAGCFAEKYVIVIPWVVRLYAEIIHEL